MKNITLFFFLLLLSIQFSLAQSESNSKIKIDILTKEENLPWLEDFKTLENKAKKTLNFKSLVF
ncbi:hypothetical protein [Bernardetia sp. MNP-M8]|uniref:hypothetical protein n=1 Tax=Bernardetia sp. MNP-M8 TaxID=3127470 RepID=UPI0030CAD6DB